MTKLYTLLFSLLIFISATAHAIGYIDADRIGKDASYETAATVESLGAYIKSKFDDPTMKARAIAIWLAYQMDKDGYTEQLMKQASVGGRHATSSDFIPNNAFKTRIGTPGDYADLFQRIGIAAGLEVVTIPGYYGRYVPRSPYTSPAVQAVNSALDMFDRNDYSLQQYQSAWNAVKIGDTWRLVDTYWLSRQDAVLGKGYSKTEMEQELKNRSGRLPSLSQLTAHKILDNTNFFAEPRLFAKTHYPLDPKWQLLDRPVTWEEFTK